MLSWNTPYTCYNATCIIYIIPLTHKYKIMLLLHFYHLVNSLLGLLCSFCLQQLHSRMIILMMNIYVNTTQFNVDIFIIDILYLFQNQKIKNTSILNFNLTCNTYFHWLMFTVKSNCYMYFLIGWNIRCPLCTNKITFYEACICFLSIRNV